MVAQITSETLTSAWRMPRPDPTDSDEIRSALETARALESKGDIREAVRWLRCAAHQAEKEGNDQRTLTLAHAAADLTSFLVGASAHGDPTSSQPPSNVRERSAVRMAVPAAPPRATPALPTSMRATQPSIPVASAPSSKASASERGIRVAVPASVRGASVFVVRRLEAGQPPPRGSSEAMLVLSGDGVVEIIANRR